MTRLQDSLVSTFVYWCVHCHMAAYQHTPKCLFAPTQFLSYRDALHLLLELSPEKTDELYYTLWSDLRSSRNGRDAFLDALDSIRRSLRKDLSWDALMIHMQAYPYY